MRVAFDDLLAWPERLREFCNLMACDGVAAIPTETFYGLAGSPGSAKAIDRILALKGRPAEKGLPVLFSTREQLERLGIEAPGNILSSFFKIWPAPLTVVFATPRVLACSGGDRSVAVRMPAHEQLLSLLKETGPLTGTSANPSGAPPLSDPNEVALAFGGGLDVLIDGGRTPGKLPSTLVDARFDPPRLLRRGAYPWDG